MTDSKTIGAIGGIVAVADGVLTYTPLSGFSGTDSFTYEVTDGIATPGANPQSIGTVSVIVSSSFGGVPFFGGGGGGPIAGPPPNDDSGDGGDDGGGDGGFGLCEGNITHVFSRFSVPARLRSLCVGLVSGHRAPCAAVRGGDRICSELVCIGPPWLWSGRAS